MRLRRDNTDDPRVEHDLDVLATSYGESMPAPPAAEAPPRKGWKRDNATDARVMADVEQLAAAYGAGPAPSLPPVDDDPMHDPFVRGFLRFAAHARGHRGYYAAFAAWLLLMFVVVPATRHTSKTDPSSAVAADASVVAATEPTSSTTSTTASSVVAAPPSYEEPAFTTVAAASASAPTTEAPPTSTMTASPEPAPAATAGDATPSRLTIVRSGYASATSRTPIEQDPGEGQLPVASTGGQDSKRSFVALAGEGTVLHLALGTGSVNDSSAAIVACPIDAPGWKADRAQPMPGPAFSQPCAAGTRLADGSWVFDLSPYGAPSSRPGFALTPAPGETVGFQVVFSATTLAPPSPR